jgi:hypothetical protein
MGNIMLSVTFLIVTACTVYPQCAFNDARKIRLLFHYDSVSRDWRAGQDSVVLIYRNYVNETTIKAVLDRYRENPFLKDLKVSGVPKSAHLLSPLINKAFSSVASLDVTNFSDGLAKFLVARGKEEMDMSLFRAIANTIKNHEEFTILFPLTAVLLKNLDPWNYSNFLNTLREAFNKDLKILPRSIVNLKGLKADDKSSEETRTVARFVQSDSGRVLLSCIELVDDVVHGRPVPGAIDSVTADGLMGGVKNTDLRNAFTLIRIVSNGIRSGGDGYILADSLKALSNDPITRNIYLGLIWQQIHGNGITFGNVKAEDVLDPGKVDSAFRYLSEIIDNTQSLSIAVDSLVNERLKQQKDLVPYYLSVLNHTRKLLTSYIAMKPFDRKIQLPQEIDAMVSLMSLSMTMAQDISLKNYNAVVLDAMELLCRAGMNSASVQNISTYLSFAANVVAAENSDDVKNAIEAVALPAGSSQIKRNSTFTIALNAYIGAYGGGHWISGKAGSGALSYGLTAPVGVAFSCGHGRKYAWSTGIFFSFVDVGAIAAFRFRGDSGIERIPSAIQLKDIVSPGIIVSLGLPCCPISINAGYQMGPNLFSVSSTSNDYRNVPYHRVSGSVCVDIPLIDFYTLPK